MGLLSKVQNIWGGVKEAASGAGRVLAGDWGGFTDIYSGVSSLFSDKDASGKLMEGYGQDYRPRVNLSSAYGVSTSSMGVADKIGTLEKAPMISDWSRNQAVAMYYLDMVNKITKQGSPRKGA